MNATDLVGFAAGITVVGSIVPQVIKAWRTRSTKDLSAWQYSIYITGLILFIIYAFLINSTPLFYTNTLSLILASSILYLILKNKTK